MDFKQNETIQKKVQSKDKEFREDPSNQKGIL